MDDFLIFFFFFWDKFRLVSKTKEREVGPAKVCIPHVPAKQNVCCECRNVFYTQARLPAG